jgi:hypothetical protein
MAFEQMSLVINLAISQGYTLNKVGALVLRSSMFFPSIVEVNLSDKHVFCFKRYACIIPVNFKCKLYTIK